MAIYPIIHKETGETKVIVKEFKKIFVEQFPAVSESIKWT
jgi:hypothetical protein